VKLADVRVVDFSPTVPGAVVARLLADHGAEVLKVESPGGTPLRQGSPDLFAFCERGKELRTLDLKDPAQLEQARTLVDAADILTESGRPGAMERLGLGYETLAARNPRLVYASFSSYGQTGPLSQRPAHDPALRALAGGLLAGGAATPLDTIDTTLAGAYLGLAGVMMALHAARRTGRGDWLDLSLHDVALTMQPHRLAHATAQPPQPRAPRSAFQDTYRTRDERWICLAGSEPAFVRRLLEGLGLDHLTASALRPDSASQQHVRATLAAAFLARSQAEWIVWFEDRHLPFAPALTFTEALAQPQAQVRGMALRDAAGQVHLNTPLRFVREPAAPRLQLPGPAPEDR